MIIIRGGVKGSVWYIVDKFAMCLDCKHLYCRCVLSACHTCVSMHHSVSLSVLFIIIFSCSVL